MILQYFRARSKFNIETGRVHIGEHGAAISKEFRHAQEGARLFYEVNQMSLHPPDVLERYIDEQNSILRILRPTSLNNSTVIVRNFRVFDRLTGRGTDVPYSHTYVLTDKSNDAFNNDPSAAFMPSKFMPYDSFVKMENEEGHIPGSVDRSYSDNFFSDTQFATFDCFKRLGFTEELFRALVDGVIHAIDKNSKVAVFIEEENRLENAESIILGVLRFLPKGHRCKLNAVSCWLKNIGYEFHLYFPMHVVDGDYNKLANDGVTIVDLIQGRTTKVQNLSKFSKFIWDSFASPEKLQDFDLFIESFTGERLFEISGLERLDAMYNIFTHTRYDENNVMVVRDDSFALELIAGLIGLFQGKFGQYPKAYKLLLNCIEIATGTHTPEIMDEFLFNVLARENPVTDDFRAGSSSIVRFISHRLDADKLSEKLLDMLVELMILRPTLQYDPLKATIEKMVCKEPHQSEFMSKLINTPRIDSSIRVAAKMSLAKTMKCTGISIEVLLSIINAHAKQIANPNITEDERRESYSVLIGGLFGDTRCTNSIVEIIDGCLKGLVDNNSINNIEIFLDVYRKTVHEIINDPDQRKDAIAFMRYIYLLYALYSDRYKTELLELYDECVKQCVNVDWNDEQLEQFKSIVSADVWQKHKRPITFGLSCFEQRNFAEATDVPGNDRINFFFDALSKQFDLDKYYNEPPEVRAAYDLMAAYWERLANEARDILIKWCVGQKLGFGYWFYSKISGKIADTAYKRRILQSMGSSVKEEQQMLLFVAHMSGPTADVELYEHYRDLCEQECKTKGINYNFADDNDWQYVAQQLQVEKSNFENPPKFIKYSILTNALSALQAWLSSNDAHNSNYLPFIQWQDATINYVSKNVSKYVETDSKLKVLRDCLLATDHVDKYVYSGSNDALKLGQPRDNPLIYYILRERCRHHLNTNSDLTVKQRVNLAIAIYTIDNRINMRAEFNFSDIMHNIGTDPQNIIQRIYHCVEIANSKHDANVSGLVHQRCAEALYNWFSQHSQSINAEFVLNDCNGSIRSGIDNFVRKLKNHTLKRRLLESFDKHSPEFLHRLGLKDEYDQYIRIDRGTNGSELDHIPAIPKPNLIICVNRAKPHFLYSVLAAFLVGVSIALLWMRVALGDEPITLEAVTMAVGIVGGVMMIIQAGVWLKAKDNINRLLPKRKGI